MNHGAELFEFTTNGGLNFRRGTQDIMAESLKFANECSAKDNKRWRI